MAKRQPVREDQLERLKYFKKLLPMLDRLHDHATARDRAGNRRLRFDQYVTLQLLCFFNPIVSSMRELMVGGWWGGDEPGALFRGRRPV